MPLEHREDTVFGVAEKNYDFLSGRAKPGERSLTEELMTDIGSSVHSMVAGTNISNLTDAPLEPTDRDNERLGRVVVGGLSIVVLSTTVAVGLNVMKNQDITDRRSIDEVNSVFGEKQTGLQGDILDIPPTSVVISVDKP